MVNGFQTFVKKFEDLKEGEVGLFKGGYYRAETVRYQTCEIKVTSSKGALPEGIFSGSGQSPVLRYRDLVHKEF